MYFLSRYKSVMVTRTFSLSEKETEECICCGGNSAVRVSRRPEEIGRFLRIPEEIDVEGEMIQCHACGYIWYRIRVEPEEGVAFENVVHDASLDIPGQPISGAHPVSIPSFLVLARPAEQAGVVGNQVQHFVCSASPHKQRSPITEEVFNDELDKRMEARRSVTRN